jgi:hypothetical protein
MPRKTRTMVPFDLVIETRPEIRVSLQGRIPVRIVGKNNQTIARVEFGTRRIRVFGARERKPQEWRYRELQLKGISS